MRQRRIGVAILCLGVALVLAGLALGNYRDVFLKAATICQECIGLG